MPSLHSVEQRLAEVEARLSGLVNTCLQLKEDNRTLKLKQSDLMKERQTLMARSDQAKSRVEAMIKRLKALEQGAS